ncbi:MAG: hypothetical protein VCC00_14125 [Deltaproteobacteria bacterium]
MSGCFLLLALAFLGLAPAYAATENEPEPTPGVTSGVPLIVEGRILALSCLLQQGDEQGDAVVCSRASSANGASLALLEKGTGRLFAFAEAQPATDPAEQAREFLAEEVRIEGRLYERAGSAILVPEHIVSLETRPVVPAVKTD